MSSLPLISNKDQFVKKYLSLIKLLKSSTFRGPIKKFIDTNCNVFKNKEESSYEEYQVYIQFVNIVNNLLMLIIQKNRAHYSICI